MVEFQHGEIRVEVVGVFFCLLLNILLEMREVVRIVSKQQSEKITGY